METRLLKLLPMLLAAWLLIPRFVMATVDTAWVRRWDGSAHQDDWAEAMALDSQGNVYVTGVTETDTVNGHYDIITLKYGPTGELLWERQYGSPGTLERPSSVAVDQQGSVYVGGIASDNWVVLKYNSSGALLWARPNGRGGCYDLALDRANDILTCGGVERTTVDFTTIKYRPNGDTAWVRFYDWASDFDDALALAIGSQGGVGVVGDCYDGSPGSDYLTVAYDSGGVLRWSATYDGPARWDSPADVAVDSAENLYVTGSSDGLSSGYDYLTIKYSPTGETLWVRRYNGTANDWDQAKAVATDAAGCAYVTGYVCNSGTGNDCATIKYGAEGETVWFAEYNGPTNSSDGGLALALNPQGGAYVAGSSYGGASAQMDCLMIKYSGSGETLWTRLYNSPHNGSESWAACEVDEQGTSALQDTVAR